MTVFALLVLLAQPSHGQNYHHDTPLGGPLREEELSSPRNTKNICAPEGIVWPQHSTNIPEEKDEFDFFFVPKLFGDLTIGLFSQIGWGVMSKHDRAKLIEKNIVEKVRQDADIKSRFSDDEISEISRTLSERVAKHDGVPKELEVKKSATYAFLKQAVMKTLLQSDLGCENQTDYSTLSEFIISEFDYCISQAKSDNVYNACLAAAQRRIPYFVGHLALQVKLKDSLKDFFPNDKDGARDLGNTMKDAINRYDQCAHTRILDKNFKEGANQGPTTKPEHQPKVDLELQTKVCVAEGVLNSMRNAAIIKIKNRLKPTTPDIIDRLGLAANALKYIKNPPCPFAEHLSKAGPFSKEQYAVLQKELAPANGITKFKDDLYKCADEMAIGGGIAIASETLRTHKTLASMYPPNPSDPHQKLDIITQEAMENAFIPCAEELKKHKTERKQAVINPEECEAEVKGFVANKILLNKLPIEFAEAIKDFKNDESHPNTEAEAQKAKEQALEVYKKCAAAGHSSEKELLDCLKNSLTQFSESVASLSIGTSLDASYLSKHPEIIGNAQKLARDCVGATFQQISSLENAQNALTGLGADCGKKIQANIVPTVAEDMVRERLAQENIPATPFIQGDFTTLKNNYLAKLAQTHGSAEQKQLLDKFQSDLGWSALNYALQVKREEYYPTHGQSLSAAEMEDHQRFAKQINEELLGEAQRKIYNGFTTKQQREDYLKQVTHNFINKVAAKQISDNLSTTVADPGTRARLQKNLMAELNACLEIIDTGHGKDPAQDSAEWKNYYSIAAQENGSTQKIGVLKDASDCSQHLQRSAAWKVYQVAVDENLDANLEKLSKKDPKAAEAIKRDIHQKFVTDSVHAELSAVATDKGKLQATTNDIKIRISEVASKGVVLHSLEKYLPAGPMQAQTLKSANDTFHECLSNIDRNTTNTKQLDAGINLCIASLAKDSSVATIHHLSSESAVKYIPAAKSTQADKIIEAADKELRTCLDNVKGSPKDDAFAAGLEACSAAVSAKTALDLGLLREKGVYGKRTAHSTPATPSNPVEKLVASTATSFTYLGEEDVRAEADKLKHGLDELLKKPGVTRADVDKAIIQSSYMNRVVEGALAQKLDVKLTTLLLPHKSPFDTSGDMETQIRRISSPSYLRPLLESTADGRAFMADLKDKLARDPNYDPASDPALEKRFTAIMMTDTGYQSFTGLALQSVARPNFDHAVAEKWTITKTGAVFFGARSQNAFDYVNVAKTPKGQEARDYFKREVLDPILAGKKVSAADMKRIQDHLEALLKEGTKQVP